MVQLDINNLSHVLQHNLSPALISNIYITMLFFSNEEEILRRRSASVLEVKEHTHSRLKEELLKALQVSNITHANLSYS